jgi:hypothetical protein
MNEINNKKKLIRLEINVVDMAIVINETNV